jgi:hypothetical protein
MDPNNSQKPTIITKLHKEREMYNDSPLRVDSLEYAQSDISRSQTPLTRPGSPSKIRIKRKPHKIKLKSPTGYKF